MTSTFCSWSVTESSQKVMFSSALIHAETTSPIFTKFGGKAASGTMKKRLDFVGNPDLDLDPGIF